MKKYGFYFLLYSLLLVAFGMAVFYSMANHLYWLAGLIFIFILILIRKLYRFLMKVFDSIIKMIDSIRFSEFNISWKKSEKDGLIEDLSIRMTEAVSRFNKRLRQSESEQQFYNSLLNRIDSGILVINFQGDIEWINKAALDEFGKPHPQHIRDLKTVAPDLPDLLENLQVKETQILKIKKNNINRPLAVSCVLFEAQGKHLKLVSIRNIESVIEESESEAWRNLIRVLTHEIMNSITPIISLSESFSENDSLNPEDQQLLKQGMNTIHRRSKGLVEFVRNYQQLTRIPSPSLTRVNSEEIMLDISKLLISEGVRFNYCINPKNIDLQVDISQLEQVLINLIKNAWEASSNSSDPKVQVEITKNEYQRPVIHVIDNGIGILPEVQERIFMPFFTTKPNGSGIGLSICRQIIKLHGGHISVESQPGQGSKFSIRL